MKLAELLTAHRIDWNKIIELGGDIATIAREARQHGDKVLHRRAVAALTRRSYGIPMKLENDELKVVVVLLDAMFRILHQTVHPDDARLMVKTRRYSEAYLTIDITETVPKIIQRLESIIQDDDTV